MSVIIKDKFDIKNSVLPKSTVNNSVIGYRDTLKIIENYLSIKLINYSSVGWVFGLAQYGITPVETSGGFTEEIYALLWNDRVVFHGNDPDLVTAEGVTFTANYLNLDFQATEVSGKLTHLLLKNINSTHKFFKIIIEPQINSIENFDLFFELSSDKTYTTSTVPLKNNYHGENLYMGSAVKVLKAILQRNTTYQEFLNHKIKKITVYGYDSIQPHVEDLSTTAFIDVDKTTGTLSNKVWQANVGDELVSSRIFFSQEIRLSAIGVDFSGCDTNIDFSVDEIWFSTDGNTWEKATFLNNKHKITPVESTFPLVFPIHLASVFDEEMSDFSLYYKIVAKENGKYIDCSKENSNFKIILYLK